MVLNAARNDNDVSLDLDEAGRAIDHSLSLFQSGILVPLEGVDRICTTASEYMRNSPASAHDVDFLIEYAREAVDAIASGVHDPVLVEYFDDRVRGDQDNDLIQARLDMLLEPLEEAAARGDLGAANELEDLCRTGLRSHQRLLSLPTAPAQILQTAYRAGVAGALAAAVSPAHAHRGQITARGYRNEMFTLALDLLAHLAADPKRGADARSALLDLLGFVGTAGEAAIRLPMHLLDDAERQRLVAAHEARVELFTADSIQAPLGLELLRDNRVVRTALWQAFDAQHIN